MKLAILGGHLSPALSIIDASSKNWEIFFIGRKYVFEGEKSVALEYQTIKKLGLEFENLSTGRFQRRFSKNTITSLLKIPLGFLNALRILIRQKPDVILGFGSYIQFPVVLAASVLKIPVVIHEQTLEAGVSNKICAKFAKKICISFRSSEEFFPKNKTVFTGIPLRWEIIKASREKPSLRKNIPQIFITGGSSGSHFINLLIEDCIEKLLDKYKVIHQTGDSKKYNDFEKLSDLRKALLEKIKKNYTIKKFIDPKDFPYLLRDCDLVISRAGINTVSEILLMQKPCILIPLPFSQRNEQLKNSLFLKNLGLAQVIEQMDVSSKLLYQRIEETIGNLGEYKVKNLLELPLGNAADKIIKELIECAKEK